MAGIKILLVDDEPDFLNLMELRLKKWGYDFLEASNGKEALERLTDKNPDIVILDYLLPDMDGVSVLKEIRQVNEKIPVIMFTAYPQAKAMEDTEELGVSAFIPKISLSSDAFSSLKKAIELIEKNKY